MSDQTYWCMSLFSCFCIFKGLWRFWCGQLSGGKGPHRSPSQFFHRIATRPLFKSDQSKFHWVLVSATHSCAGTKMQGSSCIFMSIDVLRFLPPKDLIGTLTARNHKLALPNYLCLGKNASRPSPICSLCVTSFLLSLQKFLHFCLLVRGEVEEKLYQPTTFPRMKPDKSRITESSGMLHLQVKRGLTMK